MSRFNFICLLLIALSAFVSCNNICPYVAPGFQSCETDSDCTQYGPHLFCDKYISFAPGRCSSLNRYCSTGSQKCYRTGNTFSCYAPVGGNCTATNQCFPNSFCGTGTCKCINIGYGFCFSNNRNCPSGSICTAPQNAPINAAYPCLGTSGSYCDLDVDCLQFHCEGCTCIANENRPLCVSYTDTDVIIDSYKTCINNVINTGGCGSSCCSSAANSCAFHLNSLPDRLGTTLLADIKATVAIQGSSSYLFSCYAREKVQLKCGYRTDNSH